MAHLTHDLPSMLVNWCYIHNGFGSVYYKVVSLHLCWFIITVNSVNTLYIILYDIIISFDILSYIILFILFILHIYIYYIILYILYIIYIYIINHEIHLVLFITHPPSAMTGRRSRSRRRSPPRTAFSGPIRAPAVAAPPAQVYSGEPKLWDMYPLVI